MARRAPYKHECDKHRHKPDRYKSPEGDTTWGRPTMANWTLRSWPRVKDTEQGRRRCSFQAFPHLPLLHGLLAEVPQRALLVYFGS